MPTLRRLGISNRVDIIRCVIRPPRRVLDIVRLADRFLPCALLVVGEKGLYVSRVLQSRRGPIAGRVTTGPGVSLGMASGLRQRARTADASDIRRA